VLRMHALAMLLPSPLALRNLFFVFFVLPFSFVVGRNENMTWVRGYPPGGGPGGAARRGLG